MEGCGGRSGKKVMWKQFGEVFLKSRGEVGGREKFGVGNSSWLFVKGQGFAGFDQQ